MVQGVTQLPGWSGSGVERSSHLVHFGRGSYRIQQRACQHRTYRPRFFSYFLLPFCPFLFDLVPLRITALAAGLINGADLLDALYLLLLFLTDCIVAGSRWMKIQWMVAQGSTQARAGLMDWLNRRGAYTESSKSLLRDASSHVRGLCSATYILRNTRRETSALS